MSKPTAADFRALIPDPSATMCGNFINSLLKLPVLLWQYVSALEGTDSSGGSGGILAGTVRTGDYIFSGTPAAQDATRLLCDGSEYAKTAYPALYTAIGDVYGVATNGANFKVPNFQARFPVMVGNFATSGAANLGVGGGVDKVQITEAQMPDHRHFICSTETKTGVAGGSITLDSNHTLPGLVQHAGDGSTLFGTGQVEPDVEATIGRTSKTGGGNDSGGEAHTNLPPFLPCFIYIKT